MNKNLGTGCIVLILSLFFAGCSLPLEKESPVIPSETPDINSTVNAAVAATDMAQQGLQSTIEVSVAATMTAMPPQPTPTPMNVEEITEEEVAVMVDEAVNEAMAASTTCATTAATAAADDVITEEEAQEIAVTVAASEEAIAAATELANQYLGLYAELGEETIILLQSIEEDLSAMSASTAEIEAALYMINASIEQGVAIAEETITLLETNSAAIQSQVAEIQGNAEGWKEKVSAELENRANLAENIKPEVLATDKIGAFQLVGEYVGLINNSLADGKLDLNEFTGISLAGANASESIRQFGGPGGDALAGQINTVTRNIAKGEIPQARSGLSGIERDFSSLGGNLADFSGPSLPKPPKRR